MSSAFPGPADIPPGVRLCRLEDLPDPGARNFVLERHGQQLRGFVVRVGERVFGYLDRCPHQGLPLAQQLDRYLTPDGGLIACNWHGALFRIHDGACLGGPCAGAALTPWPVCTNRGMVVTG